MSVDNSEFPSGVASAAIMFGKKIEIPNAQDKPKEEVKEEVKEVKTEEKVIKTPLGDMKVETPKETGDIFQKIKEKTELEIKSPDELIDKLNKLKELEENEKLIKNNVYNKQIVDAVAALPPELRALFNAWGTKQDYRAMGKTLFVDGVDYTQKVDDIDEFKLISHYNEISKEDWEDMDEKAQTAIIKSAKRSFENEQKQFAEGKTTIEKQKEDYANKVSDSVVRSMAQLKKDFPNLTEKQIRDIETALYQNPYADIITNDGVYTENAASAIAWQRFGKQTVEQVMSEMTQKVNKEVDEAARKAVSEEREIFAKQRGDKTDKLADGKDMSQDPVATQKQWLNNILYDPSSIFVNKTERK